VRRLEAAHCAHLDGAAHRHGSLNGSFAADITPGSGQIRGTQWLSTDGFSSDQASDMHTFGPGGHTLQLIVVDVNGLTAIDRVTVTVTDGAGNSPPLLMAWADPRGRSRLRS